MSSHENVVEEMNWHIVNAMEAPSYYEPELVKALVLVFCFYTVPDQQYDLFKKYPQLEKFVEHLQ